MLISIAISEDEKSQALHKVLARMAKTIDPDKAVHEALGGPYEKYSCFTEVAIWLKNSWLTVPEHFEIILFYQKDYPKKGQAVHGILYDPHTKRVVVDTYKEKGGEYLGKDGYVIPTSATGRSIGVETRYDLLSKTSVRLFRQYYFR